MALSVKKFKARCISLRKRGLSLIEIAKDTGRPKTSVYTHIRGMLPSQEMRLRWLEESAARIVTFNKTRKGISSLGRYPKKFTQWTPGRVMLVAHLLFDGEIKKTGCVYNNRSKVLIERVRKEMKAVYAFPPKEYVNPLTGVWRISYHNVILGALMQEKSQELIEKISAFPPTLQRAFLRAFFDDEGCMDFRPIKRQRRVRGYQKNIRILRVIQFLLKNFNIASKLQKPNEVVIVRKDNLVRFQKKINFSAGIRMNGLRSNSRWKQNLEKREILRRAIASYNK